MSDPAAEPHGVADASPPRRRRHRRVVRRGTENPEFSESAWTEPAHDGRPTPADDERILREKPPHWG